MLFRSVLWFERRAFRFGNLAVILSYYSTQFPHFVTDTFLAPNVLIQVRVGRLRAGRRAADPKSGFEECPAPGAVTAGSGYAPSPTAGPGYAARRAAAAQTLGLHAWRPTAGAAGPAQGRVAAGVFGGARAGGASPGPEALSRGGGS